MTQIKDFYEVRAANYWLEENRDVVVKQVLQVFIPSPYTEQGAICTTIVYEIKENEDD